MDDAPPPGLALLYAVLEDTATAGGWDALAIVVEDPDLGRQVFATGPPGLAFAAAPDEPERTWWAVPPTEEAPAQLGALRALARTALRLASVDDCNDPTSALEVRLRRMPEVDAVERHGGVLVATAAADALDSVAADLAAHPPAASGLVVLRGRPSAVGGSPPPGRRAELLTVRAVPESGELEVHLRLADRRTVGRGPLAGAGAAAADATLAALADAGAFGGGPVTRPRVAWVRTIEATPERRFLVATALGRGDGPPLYGLAAGASPIEAAVRATLQACNRITTRTTTG